MKTILKLIAVVLLVYLAVFFLYLPGYLISDDKVEISAENEDAITIMSANVRCLAPEDLLNKSWFYRAELMRSEIDSVKPDIIGFQESTFIHYSYLEKIMEGYDSENAYRDDFVLSEGCPIFWRSDKFEKVDSGAFWLSETPDVMSKDWGSEHYRICVYVVLRELSGGKQFAVFNTHLDHTSNEARINGIQVVLDKIKEFGDIPAYLMGDMNAKEDSKTMQYAYESFEDSKLVAPITDENPTYQGWGEADNPRRIDYILISRGDAEVIEYHVVDNKHDGAYSSDHSPIYIKTKLK